jgi:tRNA threonylcarbamoyladenosine biosynthesis protein TsaB
MVVAGIDTSTPATSAAILRADGSGWEHRREPAAGARPAHVEVLAVLDELLRDVGTAWDEIDRLAVGIGPGGFTGLRIGIATARALAQARGIELVGVGSLEALAAGAPAHEGPVAAVLDARRGEAFLAVYEDGTELLAPAALRPEALEAAVAALPGRPLAVGDGALAFRAQLERAGAVVAHDGPVHSVRALWVCRLGADPARRPAAREALLPDYRREPDAKPK